MRCDICIQWLGKELMICCTTQQHAKWMSELEHLRGCAAGSGVDDAPSVESALSKVADAIEDADEDTIDYVNALMEEAKCEVTKSMESARHRIEDARAEREVCCDLLSSFTS